MSLFSDLMANWHALSAQETAAIDQYHTGQISRGEMIAAMDNAKMAEQACHAAAADDDDRLTSHTADSHTIAVVNGVVVDLASPEYAAWYAANYGYYE
jgi:hypothetical protein